MFIKNHIYVVFLQTQVIFLGAILHLHLPSGKLGNKILADDFLDIIGGQDVNSHSRLYMASIQRHREHVCGGALIEPQWVLTAAHCTKDKEVDDLEVVLGVHSLSKQKNKQRIKVMKIIPHPGFKNSSPKNDIMLLQLKNKAILNTSVLTLKLPKSTEKVKPGTKCSVAGWGATDASGSLSDTLKEANVTVLKSNICKKIYPFKLTKDEICAGDENQKQDACEGDSGGPLLCEKKGSRQDVYRGIVSYGTRCNVTTKPGVYTRLSKKYLSWIKKEMRK